MHKVPVVILSFVMFGVGTAQAAEFSLGGRVGIPGTGVEAGLKFSDYVGLRAGFGGLGYSFDFTYDDVDYDVKSSVAVGALMLDFHPMGGVFRVTAGGAYYHGNYDITASPSTAYSYQIGNTTYTGTQIGTLNGTVEYRKAAPYLGVGWDFMARKKAGFGISVDAGVYFIGKPNDVTLTTTGGVVSNSDLALETKNIEDDSASYDIAVGVGLYYRF